jgi:peroxiredoxin
VRDTNVDTKTLFTVVLVAGIVGGFALNNSLFRDMTGLDDTIEVGTEAPDFTLVDSDGNEFSLSDFEGEKVIVLEFMNMRCGTCKNFEENSLKSYCDDTMPEDVEVISITQTKNADDDELTERTEEMGWSFIKGKEEVTDAFGADRSPTVVIIDKNGMITFSKSGGMSQSDLEKEIDAALFEKVIIPFLSIMTTVGLLSAPNASVTSSLPLMKLHPISSVLSVNSSSSAFLVCVMEITSTSSGMVSSQ